MFCASLQLRNEPQVSIARSCDCSLRLCLLRNESFLLLRALALTTTATTTTNARQAKLKISANCKQIKQTLQTLAKQAAKKETTKGHSPNSQLAHHTSGRPFACAFKLAGRIRLETLAFRRWLRLFAFEFGSDFVVALIVSRANKAQAKIKFELVKRILLGFLVHSTFCRLFVSLLVIALCL